MIHYVVDFPYILRHILLPFGTTCDTDLEMYCIYVRRGDLNMQIAQHGFSYRCGTEVPINVIAVLPNSLNVERTISYVRS